MFRIRFRARGIRATGTHGLGGGWTVPRVFDPDHRCRRACGEVGCSGADTVAVPVRGADAGIGVLPAPRAAAGGDRLVGGRRGVYGGGVRRSAAIQL